MENAPDSLNAAGSVLALSHRRLLNVRYFAVVFILFFILVSVFSGLGVINKYKSAINISERVKLSDSGEMTVLKSICIDIGKYLSFPLGILAVVFFAFMYLGPFIASIGLFRLNNWARALAVFVSSLWILLFAYHLIMKASKDIHDYSLTSQESALLQFYIKQWVINGGAYLYIFFFLGFCIYYLTRPTVEALFVFKDNSS